MNVFIPFNDENPPGAKTAGGLCAFQKFTAAHIRTWESLFVSFGRGQDPAPVIFALQCVELGLTAQQNAHGFGAGLSFRYVA